MPKRRAVSGITGTDSGPLKASCVTANIENRFLPYYKNEEVQNILLAYLQKKSYNDLKLNYFVYYTNSLYAVALYWCFGTINVFISDCVVKIKFKQAVDTMVGANLRRV